MANTNPNPLADQMWRIKNLFKCRREGDGTAIPLRLRPEQEVVVKHLIDNPAVPLYIIKSRRLGISTIVDTFQAERCVFSSGFRGVIIDQTKDDAVKKMVEIVRFAIRNLPPEILKDFIIDKENDSEFRMHLKSEKETQDSVIFASIGARGGDASFLHISEWGTISALDPARSREIRTGAFPAARKGRRVVETTWYGGKTGELWDLVKPIMDGNPNAEGVIHFFPWHCDPEAVRFDGSITPETEEYFRDLSARLDKKFTDNQKRWYAAKKIEQGIWVKREFPSTLDESLSVPMAGTIYGDLLDQLREKKRVHNFFAERVCPAFTFWDIGFSDFGCIWLLQFVGRDILALDYCTATGETAMFYANRVKKWSDEHNVTIARHYLPHDADTRERSSGKSYKDALIVAGMNAKEITVVPRTPDVWLGINELRTLLPRFYIHATNCGTPVTLKGGEKTLPSGIDCLEFYHKREGSNNGVLYDEPVHDEYSHGASALRTFSESYRLGMIEGTSFVAKEKRTSPVRVVRGPGPESYGASRRAVNVIR